MSLYKKQEHKVEQFDDLFNISRLIAGHLTGDLNTEEENELNKWLEADTHNRILFEKLTKQDKLTEDYQLYQKADKQVAWEHIASEIGYSRKSNLWTRVAAAACIVFTLFTGIWYINHRNNQISHRALLSNSNKIVPANQRALLTLADGQQISLDNAQDGKLAKQGNSEVSKISEGLLAYQDQEKSISAELLYNVVSTPKGGHYEVILPDGSHVWLNAASSIRFPVAFSNKSREVSITGEAYFEVATDINRSFSVKAADQIVQVLGTHFNINAYQDDGLIRTALITGSVHVSSGKEHVLLKPGQQACSRPDGTILVNNIPSEEALAWKNGLFQFTNAHITTIMAQISRWYDVEISYRGNFEDQQFSLTISRYADVKDVLKFLEATGVIHFKVEERRIVVMR